MTKFICIGGKAQHGKDTSATMLKEELESKGYKVLIAHYAGLLKYICKSFFNWDGKKNEQGRNLLQKVGTEGIRSKRPDYWVDFIIGIISMFPEEWDFVIIPDTRFPNELNKIKQCGYPMTYIKIVRDNFDNGLTQEQQNHISEIALDNVVPDIIIHNDGTLDSLNKKTNDICKRYLLGGEHTKNFKEKECVK